MAEFISKIELSDIPLEVRETAKLHLIDGLATMIAGSNDGASRAIRDYIGGLDRKGEATVIGTTKKLAAQHAALANGVQGMFWTTMTLNLRPYALVHSASKLTRPRRFWLPLSR